MADGGAPPMPVRAAPPKEKVYAIPGIQESEVADTRDAFNFFDQENTGAVDLKELVTTIQSLGLADKNPGAFRMLTRMAESNARVDFEEFVDLMTARMNYREASNDLQEVFKMFDGDNTGKISLTNLKTVSEELGEDLAEEELRDMLVRADTDGDNELSESEFVQLMQTETAL